MSLVVDNSVALTWCFEDERTPATAALLEQVGELGGFAPMLWPLEALNGLLVAERRGRLDASRRRRLAGFLHALPITLDADTANQAWTATARLAERFGLSVYDAAYLELAQRDRLPLATLDCELRSARCGAGAFGPRALTDARPFGGKHGATGRYRRRRAARRRPARRG